MSNVPYKNLKSACKELNISTAGVKTEPLTKMFMDEVTTKLKEVPEGKEREHFSENLISTYNAMYEDFYGDGSTEASGEDASVENTEATEGGEETPAEGGEGTNECTPAEAPAETPAEAPAETPADAKPADKPKEKPKEKKEPTEKKASEPRYTRVNALAEALNKGGTYDDIVVVADDFYMKRGGPSNVKESKFYARIGIPLLKELGLLTDANGVLSIVKK